MKYIILCLIGILTVSTMFAQDFAKDMAKVSKFYNTSATFQTDISIKSFQSYKDETPKDQQTARIQRSGNNYYYKFQNVEMLVNEKYSIIVDNDQKMMVCKPLEKVKRKKVTELATPDFDLLTKSYKKVEFKGKKNGVKHYVVYPKRIYKQADIYINEKGLITKLVYLYNSYSNQPSAKVIVNFKNSTTSPTFSKSHFSETKYFKVIKKKYVPIGKYESYNLLKVKDDE